MLSAVLRSEIAIKISVEIMLAFVKLRHLINDDRLFSNRLTALEYRQKDNDSKFKQLFNFINKDKTINEQGIFFDGQIYDSYDFLTTLIKSARKTIYIVDNYVDETMLTMCSKKKSNVELIIFTKTISKQIKLDVSKFNAQYPKARIVELNKSHDRFLIIDKQNIYHFGASLKDLGKKWFAFNKLENDAIDLISKLDALLHNGGKK
jgi:hypothetical protein